MLDLSVVDTVRSRNLAVSPGPDQKLAASRCEQPSLGFWMGLWLHPSSDNGDCDLLLGDVACCGLYLHGW